MAITICMGKLPISIFLLTNLIIREIVTLDEALTPKIVPENISSIKPAIQLKNKDELSDSLSLKLR